MAIHLSNTARKFNKPQHLVSAMLMPYGKCTDQKLFNCLTNAHSGETLANELTALSCGYNVASLQGLTQFSGITHLDLSGNNVT